MADDFVSRRHAEIDAEIHLNDSQVAIALDTVARCRQRLVDLPVAVKVVADSLLRLGRGPADGSSGNWTLDDVTDSLHDNSGHGPPPSPAPGSRSTSSKPRFGNRTPADPPDHWRSGGWWRTERPTLSSPTTTW